MSLVALNGMVFDLTTPHGRMMATLLAGIAQYVERTIMRSGIALPWVHLGSTDGALRADVLRMMKVSRHKHVEIVQGYVRRANLFKAHAGTGFL